MKIKKMVIYRISKDRNRRLALHRKGQRGGRMPVLGKNTEKVVK
jgi:hypothetical protein